MMGSFIAFLRSRDHSVTRDSDVTPTGTNNSANNDPQEDGKNKNSDAFSVFLWIIVTLCGIICLAFLAAVGLWCYHAYLTWKGRTTKEDWKARGMGGGGKKGATSSGGAPRDAGIEGGVVEAATSTSSGGGRLQGAEIGERGGAESTAGGLSSAQVAAAGGVQSPVGKLPWLLDENQQHQQNHYRRALECYYTDHEAECRQNVALAADVALPKADERFWWTVCLRRSLDSVWRTLWRPPLFDPRALVDVGTLREYRKLRDWDKVGLPLVVY